jgi:hypothetical protein
MWVYHPYSTLQTCILIGNMEPEDLKIRRRSSGKLVRRSDELVRRKTYFEYLVMQEHRQQSTSGGQLGALAHILKKFKF